MAYRVSMLGCFGWQSHNGCVKKRCEPRNSINRVTLGGGAVTEALLEILEEKGIRDCVIGRQAANHYAEPLVSLDLDPMIATDQPDQV